MKPRLLRGLAACLMALPLTLSLAAPRAGWAQGGPPPGGGGFGGPPPPGVMQQFQAWDKWRASHPNVEAVSRTLRGLEGMELGRPGFGSRPGGAPNPASQLNAAQARKMLVVLQNWRSKPVMTEAQAGAVNQQLLRLLNPSQKANLAARRGPGGSGGRGFGGPGGGPGMGGPPPGDMGGSPGQGRGGRPPFGGGPNGRPGGGFPRGGFFMPAPHDYNPLNPATIPMSFMRDRAAQRLGALMARLSAAAK